MSASVLVRREIAAPGEERAVVLGIHGHAGSVDQLDPLCRSLGADVAAVLPQAWRPLNIHGVAEDVHPGYSWYFSFGIDQPEPATFGDCLIELEALVYDLFEEDEQRSIIVLGFEQGASLALALAGVVPDFLSGVVAIGGVMPRIKGWSFPVENLGGLPVLQVSDAGSGAERAALTDSTAQYLRDVHARVETHEHPGAWQYPLVSASIVRDWIARQRPAQRRSTKIGDSLRV
jgi:predicted esterase